jgi:ribosomal protein L19
MADIKAVEAPKNPNIPELQPGDTVNVHVRIKEGDRERIQEFKGTVIRLRKGGNEASFTVRRGGTPYTYAACAALLPARPYRQIHPAQAKV